MSAPSPACRRIRPGRSGRGAGPGWAVALALLGACTEPAGGPLPVWTAVPEAFWDAPWPADHRRDDDGTISVAGFPNPREVPLLDRYLAHVEQLDGFGTNAPVWFPLAGPIDPAALPSPTTSVEPGSTLLLLDVDPRSPGWGEAVPLQWAIPAVDGRYWPADVLAVAPVFGFPLRPRTTYAAVVTTAAAAPHPGFAEVWAPDHPLHDEFAPLRDVLFVHGLSTHDVAVATVFTTGEPVAELARVARFLHDHVAPPDLDLDLEEIERFTHYTAWRAHYPSPVFTHGERPFTSEGGGFRFREADGQPIIAWWDDARLSVCAPVDLSDPPPDGWPVVVYQHGTGGDYRTFCDSDAPLEVASRLGARGIVGLGLDQPLHGTRGGSAALSDLASFNVLNPDSGVTNFRQGAVDAIYLTRALASRPWTLRTADGALVPLDPDRVLFMGHSQGGLTGALAAPFMGAHVRGVVLSGAGGGLAITVVERKDPVDYADLLRTWLDFDDGEEVTTLHPVVGLIQTAAEVTDPLNYAPYWFAEEGGWPGQAPVPILVTSGVEDVATPWASAVALAAAGRLPQLHPAATQGEALTLRGIAPRPGPLARNAVGYDGAPVTAAFSQWADGTHFVVFEERAASDLYVDFLDSAAAGAPFIALRE